MKVLKYILWGLLTVVALVIVIGLFLPRQIHVERSRVIDAPANLIFDQINSLKKWSAWSPWHRIDPNMKINYFGPESGHGAGYTWSSNNDSVGNGKMVIAISEPGRRISTSMEFMENHPSSINFLFTPEKNGTKVTWTLDSDMGMNPFMRWMGLMMDKFTGPHFEAGLRNLDSLVKAMPRGHVGSIALMEYPGANALSIRGTIAPKDIPMVMAKDYSEIMKYAGSKGLVMKGAPFAIYHTWSDTTTDMESALPYDKADPGSGRIKGLVIPKGTVVRCEFFGPYEQSMMAHMAVEQWAKDNGKKLGDEPWEEYITDPGTEPDQSKWLTRIYYWVK